MTYILERFINVIEEKHHSLIYTLGEIQGQIINLSLAIEDIRETVNGLKQMHRDVDQINEIEENIDFSHPCKSYTEFVNFDERLSNDEVFLKKIVSFLILCMHSVYFLYF